jgi:hypothetical protein
MKQMTPDTLIRLKRAAIFSVCAFILFVIDSKFSHYSKFSGYITPKSWSFIANNLDAYILISLCIGGLAYFWPSTWKFFN